MKLKNIRKNAMYMLGYGCSIRKFKKAVRTSPDANIRRVPARKLAAIVIETRGYLFACDWKGH